VKSFKSFLVEFPMVMDFLEPEDQNPDYRRSFLTKPIDQLVTTEGGVFRRMKPKKIGTHEVDGKKYTFYHDQKTSRDPFSGPTTTHHMFTVDDRGTVIGVGRGNTIGKTDKTHAIGMDMAAIHPEHRGRKLYASMLANFVNKTGHTLFSDETQTLGSKKTWQHLADNSESLGLDFRAHPRVNGKILAGKTMTQSHPGMWQGQPDMNSKDIILSIRRKESQE
jgi:hypothetical protein